MLRPAVIAILAAASAIPAQALAAAEVDIAATGPVIELNVNESVEVAPDIATIGAGVTTDAATATAAMEQNSQAMQQVVARIKALGIAPKDIQTTGINLNPRYDYDQTTQRQVFRGYQAQNRVSVILRNIDAAGRVLDALVAAGATDLSGPSFGIDDDEPAKAEARKRAVARADAQARSYAAMLGYQNVKVLAISESMNGSGPVMPMSKMRGVAEMQAAAPPVEPGMVWTGISVAITYELVGKTGAGAGQ
jgi:uncharacterized protein YggE